MAKGRAKSRELKDLQKVLARSRELRKGHYTVRELIEATGMSLRQVRNWRETGLLVPCVKNPKARGSQPAIFYSTKQVLRALIIVEMTRRGLSLQQVRTVEANLRKGTGKQLEETTKFLLTDGENAYYAENANRVIDILKTKQQMLLIPVWEHMLHLKQKLRKVA